MSTLTKELIDKNMEFLKTLKVDHDIPAIIEIIPGLYRDGDLKIPEDYILILSVNFEPIILKVSGKMTAIYLRRK